MNPVTAILFLPPSARGAGSVAPALELLGLPLIRRNVLSATRAGISNIFIVTEDPADARRLLEGTKVSLLSPGEPLPTAERILVLAGGILADSRWLTLLAEIPLQQGDVYLDPGVLAILDGERLASGSAWRDDEDFFSFLRDLPTKPLRSDTRERFILTSQADTPEAERWLLRRLMKSGDSLLTRWINRPISLAITRRLAVTTITPNQVTAVSLLIGFTGALFFLSTTAAWQAVGGGLLLIHNIVDGCDGELARLKFQSSHTGMILDLWGDNMVHAALFLCMGVGWSLTVAALWPLGIAGLAVAGTLWTAWLVYRQTMRWTALGAAPQFSSVVRSQTTRTARIMNALGNRDFLYGIFVLSLFGKAHWILPLVAVGSPLFAIGLLFLSRPGRSTP